MIERRPSSPAARAAAPADAVADDDARGRGRAGPGAGALLLRRRRSLVLLSPPLLLLLVVVALRSRKRAFDGGVGRATSSPAVAAEEEEDPFALARTQSGGFFYDVPASDWERHRTIFLAHEDHRYPRAPWTFHPSLKGGKTELGGTSYETWYQQVSARAGGVRVDANRLPRERRRRTSHRFPL